MTSVDENRNCVKEESCGRLTVVICCKKAIVKYWLLADYMFSMEMKIPAKLKSLWALCMYFTLASAIVIENSFFLSPSVILLLLTFHTTDFKWQSSLAFVMYRPLSQQDKKIQSASTRIGFSVFFICSFRFLLSMMDWWEMIEVWYMHTVELWSI